MIKRPVLVLILLILVMQHIAAQDEKQALDLAVDRIGNKFLSDQLSPGLSIGVYSKGESYFYNFGTTETGKNSPPTSNTIYEIGSITKTFTSFILANAVLENKVRLEDDIRKYIKGDYPNLEYSGHPIRLVYLANTTSLLPDWLPELPAEMKGLSPDSALAVKTKFYRNLTRADFFKALHKVKLDTIPGFNRKHSNAAAQLLAYILEDVYKMSMEKLIEKYITGPFKMTNTAFINSEKNKSLAKGYTSSNTKAVYEFVMPYFQYAGGLGSTTADLIRYIEMLLDKTNKAAALSLQKTADMSVSSGKVIAMKPDRVANPTVYSAALNWFKYHPDVNNLQIWADGGTNGFNSYVVIYPFKNAGVVVLANRSDEKTFRSLPGIASEISKALKQK